MKTENRFLKGKHVLLVDDDIELVLAFQELLQEHDYRTSIAANGAQGLKLVQNSEVDAILCDLNMPELAGDLFYLKVGQTRPELLKRFIFVTANGDNPLYETFLKNTKAPVLSKPVSMDLLLEKLEALLRVETSPST